MIHNFEDYTKELSVYEKRFVLPFIVNLFEKEKRIGKENSLTNKEIVQLLNENGFVSSSPRIRKIIGYIRKNDILKDGYVLIACSKGYYLSNNFDEINKQIKSLEERANCINEVAKAMRNKISNIDTKKYTYGI